MTLTDFQAAVLKYYEKYGKNPEKVSINPLDFDEIISKTTTMVNFDASKCLSGTGGAYLYINGIPTYKNRHVPEGKILAGGNDIWNTLFDVPKEKDPPKISPPEASIPTYWNF